VVNPRSQVARKDEYQPTLIKQGASIGANATVVCGVTIGAYAFVGAGAVVTRDVPVYGLVYGAPARLQGWMCQCGLKLQFEAGQAVCTGCGLAYEKHRQAVRLIPGEGR